jgi:hypothetical protein
VIEQCTKDIVSAKSLFKKSHPERYTSALLNRLTFPSEILNANLNYQICDKLVELVKDSYSFENTTVFDHKIEAEKYDVAMYWYCQHCETRNSSETDSLKCSECDVFRPIDTYESFFYNYKYATKKDKELLKRRKLEEINLITLQNEIKCKTNDDCYLIDESWLKDWEKYAFEDEKSYSLQTSQHFSESQLVCYPGEISNNVLAEASKDTEKVDVCIKYRILNSHLWNTFYRIYGGGPKVFKTSGHIYAENANFDREEEKFNLKIAAIKSSHNLDNQSKAVKYLK